MNRLAGMRNRRILFVLLIVAGVAAFSFGGRSDASSGPLAAPPRAAAASSSADDEILVRFRPGTSAPAISRVHALNQGQVRRTLSGIGVQVVSVPAGKARDLADSYKRNPDVLFAERNGTYRAIGMPSDVQVGQQWQYNNTGLNGGKPGADIDAFDAWDITMGSASIAVAIIDTGIDQNHPDLVGKVTKNVNFSQASTVDDYFGHGTHVAGTVAAATNNGVGVSGTCPACSLYNVKALADDGTGSWADVANGIIWAADNGAQVINMSIGDIDPSAAVEAAVNYAWSKGVVIVAAAGNNATTQKFYPAAYANVISVAASDERDNRASFSEYGNWVDVAAPGNNILSTAPTHFNQIWLLPVTYGVASGTSMASPHVAGIAGLVWSTGLCSTNTCVRQRIEGRADAITGTGSSWIYGRVNARNSVVSGATTPAPPRIFSLSPSTGAPPGGTSVAVLGSGFTAGATVKFGGAAATGVSCPTLTTCTVTAPPGSGVAAVRVTANGLTSTTSAADLFTYAYPPCASVATTVNPPSPQTQGTSIVFAATAAGCSTPEYRFWLRPPGGAWAIVRDYALGNSWTWDTGAVAAGSYTISVWARQVGSANDYDTYKETSFTVLSRPICTSVNVTPNPASPQPVGTSVSFSATASGCSAPEFRFWLLAPGGSWQLMRDWGGGSWSWNTIGLATGNYTVSVWARTGGSAGSYEAFKETPYTISLPPGCSSVAVTPTPASPQPAGISVTFNASANGCPGTPEYRFWLLPPGGTWQLKRDWNTAATWTWATGGQSQGSYTVSVWARTAGSGGSYEAYKETPYVLSNVACSSVAVTPTPAPPQTPGTSVNFAAAASGCTGTPEYKFWVLPPGGAWQQARDWGSGNWTWATSGLASGTYTISVWTRSVGSGAQYEAYRETAYALSAGCASVDVNTSPMSPQRPGPAITFTGTANGCPGPSEYRFWLLMPGGSWQLVRDWDGNSWTWQTSGLATGTYTVSVWTRAIGSGAQYDAYREIQYVMSPPAACSSVNLMPSPASPQLAGTSVTFTATASACIANPEYRFWIRPPGGAWQIVRDWDGASWTWSTTDFAPGSYTISVWARPSGSSIDWEAFHETTFTLQ